MFMRSLGLAFLATAFLALPAAADDGQMVTLKANQIAQIFCLSRTGNDEAVISGIIAPDLQKAIDVADQKNDEYAKKNPDEEPPLGDGIPWQSSPDYAPNCDIGLVQLSKNDAKVELKYGFPDDPQANFTDTLILKKIPQAGFDVGFWRIDNVLYPDGTDLKGALVSAFDGIE